MGNESKDHMNITLAHTKTAMTKMFDTIDNIDRRLYGRRMKLFIWGCLFVLILAPLLDVILGVKHDRITYYSTLTFFVFLVVLVLAYIGSWRDDDGNWSIGRAKSRLQIYYETLKDTVETTRTNSQDENLFKLGQILFFGGLGWKALQNLSVFVRKPIEALLGSTLLSLRTFETFTNHYYWVPIVLGLGVVYYLYNKNPRIVKRIKSELGQLFGWSSKQMAKSEFQNVQMEVEFNDELVINAKTKQQIDNIKSTGQSTLFNDFATALQNWNPRGAYYEYQYQDRLYRHLRKHLPNEKVEMEYPIGERSLGNRGRADIVINDFILIEMKRDSSAGAVQRAKGQIHQYSEIWNNRGPVVLLLCDYDYEHAKLSFTTTMHDLAKLNRPVITIVAKPK